MGKSLELGVFEELQGERDECGGKVIIPALALLKCDYTVGSELTVA